MTIFSLPFIAKKPLDLPPIISVELIQITDKTNIPFAPKAQKIIEKVKKEEEKLSLIKKQKIMVEKIKNDVQFIRSKLYQYKLY